MLRKLYHRLVGTADDRALRGFRSQVDAINARERALETWTDDDLRTQTATFRQQVQERTAPQREAWVQASQSVAEAQTHNVAAVQQARQQVQKQWLEAERQVLDSLLVDAFAAVREACKRTLGKRHYDVQLLGGMVLHQGAVAEMKTGEGKTFVAALPLYLNALAGRGVHLVTPNDYLSKVGVQLMGPIYHLLGASVSVIQNQGAADAQGSFLYDPDHRTADDRYQSLKPFSRREAYACDVTYGTNNEFGFDFLRDNMARSAEDRVQRPLHYAIVDEADNILIDEARTPLIISGVARESSNLYQKFASVVKPLRAEQDYAVQEKERTVTLTEEGLARVERVLGVDNLYAQENAEMLPYLDNALRAQVLYRRDVEYLVRQKEVIIVDEFTGRMMEGRRFSEGLHQAIEAKEGVAVQRESMTLASITFQNYFRMYHCLAGMTGTAKTEEEELGAIYDLDVIAVPTYKPVIREDYMDVVYRDKKSKYHSVMEEIKAMHDLGRPVLVGTASIETSELLSQLLRRARIPHEVLNAKNHEREAVIIAQAGRRGAVTLATNMAGRGVDILLGGNPEGLARERLRKEKFDLTDIKQQDWNQALDGLARDQDPAAEMAGDWVQTLAATYRQVETERREVLELGGLHVVGTERHESRRIDNQLRGRSGRLGDPGSSRFFLSLEDELMLRFGGERVSNLMTRFKMEETPIENNIIDRVIENAQVKVEGFYFDSRKNVLQYDEVVNEQRAAIYQQRDRILEAESAEPLLQALVAEFLAQFVSERYAERDEDEDEDEEEENTKNINEFFPPHSPSLPVALREHLGADEPGSWNEEQAQERLPAIGAETIRRKKEQFADPALLDRVFRDLMLNVIDNLWTRHLTDLDHLREGIGLRALAQIRPIVAYQQEAYGMFATLQEDIREQVARSALALQVRIVEAPARIYDRVRTNRQNDEAVLRPVLRARAPGRNDPCPCGSGRKYKHCHMLKDKAALQT